VTAASRGAPGDRPGVTFYGRRKGHPLRPRAGALVTSLLPRLAVPLPDPDGRGFDPRTLFPDPARPLRVEIGFGRGEHLAAQAAAHPDINFIGCEPFLNGVAGLLMEIDTRGLENVRIFAEDARLLLPALPEAIVDRLDLLFPDPWPKARHNKRRFIGRETLDTLARILTDGAEFRFATDHMDYCRWTLERLAFHSAFQWTAQQAANWRDPPPDWVETRYERKARAGGAACVYLRYRRRARL